MTRRSALVAAAAAFGAVAAAACVDLDALGRGGPRDPRGSADTGPPRFCGPDSGALFCDDFDDPAMPLATAWPGAAGILPSPVRIGERVAIDLVTPALPSSPPNAISFFARREAGERRPIVGIAREFGVGGVRAAALVVRADVRIDMLTALPGDPEPTDAGVPDAPPDAPSDTGSAGDARPQGTLALPDPNVATLGIVSVAPSLDGVQATMASEGLYLTSGLNTDVLARAQVSNGDYVRASQATWIRLTLAVGEPSAVEALARRETQVDVTCPRTPAVAALWPSIPPGAVSCIEASDGFSVLPSRRVGLSLGVAPNTPQEVRLLVDSVRVDEVR